MVQARPPEKHKSSLLAAEPAGWSWSDDWAPSLDVADTTSFFWSVVERTSGSRFCTRWPRARWTPIWTKSATAVIAIGGAIASSWDRWRRSIGTARRVIIAPLLDDDGSELVGRHTIRYDYLVIAVGSVTNDFGIAGVKQHCLFLDDRPQADRFRSRLLNHCLRVSRTMSQDGAADQYVRIAIVGGGATGVELAAELYNAAQALRHYGLEVFDETRLEVTLMEAGPRILPLLPEALAEAAREQLEALGVKVLVGRRVVEVTANAVITAQGDEIEADLKVWAAGVRGPDILKDIGGLGDHRVQPTAGSPDPADNAGRPNFRDRGLLFLPGPSHRQSGAASGAGRPPDGERDL
jgi:hypothetical protein